MQNPDGERPDQRFLMRACKLTSNAHVVLVGRCSESCVGFVSQKQFVVVSAILIYI